MIQHFSISVIFLLPWFSFLKELRNKNDWMKLTSHLLRQQYNFQPFMFKIDLPTFANSNVISSICHHRCRCVFSQCLLGSFKQNLRTKVLVSNTYKYVVRSVKPFYKASVLNPFISLLSTYHDWYILGDFVKCGSWIKPKNVLLLWDNSVARLAWANSHLFKLIWIINLI